MNSLTVRLLLAAACIVGSQISISRIQSETRASTLLADHFDTDKLPLQLGEWHGENIVIDDRQMHFIGATSATQRTYKSESGKNLSVFLASASAAECVIPHHPTDCYSRAGWKILSDSWVKNGGENRYRVMKITHDDKPALVIYWYQIGADVVSDRDELRLVAQQRRWQHQTFEPMVKVLVHVPLISFPDDIRSTGVESIVDAIYDWIRSSSK